jgi:hypothetical protein
MSTMFDVGQYPRNNTQVRARSLSMSVRWRLTRESQFFVGEYACTSTNDTDALGTPETGRLLYPTIQGATAEAAFMTGMERNSDVVFASACAFHVPLCV